MPDPEDPSFTLLARMYLPYNWDSKLFKRYLGKVLKGVVLLLAAATTFPPWARVEAVCLLPELRHIMSHIAAQYDPL